MYFILPYINVYGVPPTFLFVLLINVSYFLGLCATKLNITKKVNIFCHSFQKVKPIYYIDSLHTEWNISSLYFLNVLWLWLSDNENPKFSVHLFLSNVLLPVNFVFNMLWYSTLWTAPSFSNDPLWLFVEGVNDRLLDHCQVSSVPHYCAFKEQEIPIMYTVWMVIYWNSNVNILIFWDTDFWLSLAVSSNHQN